MRGKRSKQYRKLMHQYGLPPFNFREPYQVLIDAQMVLDTYRFKMDLVPSLTRTLHGQIKPMITQCSIRHLFALPTATSSSNSTSAATPAAVEPTVTPTDKTALLSVSRTFELRRCNHHTLPSPLPTLECYQSVIDPNSSRTNKHRLVLAAQDESVRQWGRKVSGVPMLYVKRSVMIMEPMAEASVRAKEGVEKGKLRSGVKVLKGERGGKRKREEEEGQDDERREDGEEKEAKKRKKEYGLKGPNPLSVKKKKMEKVLVDEGGGKGTMETTHTVAARRMGVDDQSEIKRKRKRKHKGTAAEAQVDGAQSSRADITIADGG